MTRERILISPSGRSLELEYCWTGAAASDAPVMVFLHEGLGSIAMWRGFPQRLCDRLGVRGLIYSRFGYGHSTARLRHEKLPRNYLHREATEVLPEFLDALGVTRPYLFGHSDGGSIALLAAADDASRYPAIIVMAPHIFVEDICVENIQAARVAYHEKGLRERLDRYHDDVDSTFYGWHDIWLDPAYQDWNIEAEVEKIACPVLAIQGEDDEYATLEQIYGIKRRVPETTLLILPGCGHSPQRDQPESVIQGVLAFITSNASRLSTETGKLA
ncbi:alpha/beta fold hydrolase [Propionivibrio sp.]|uniref:alpha/beta fold hydrolase n=1 Tax=Propionivibrio sp. TaxID=2212460 RepID=UPI003BF03843